MPIDESWEGTMDDVTHSPRIDPETVIPSNRLWWFGAGNCPDAGRSHDRIWSYSTGTQPSPFVDFHSSGRLVLTVQ
ncbi:MAG: hypothetical protein LLG20_27420 [Acidobacteriales bacterium]|nr:hypothetical protein [Terriglobales bacterium]